ncbi:MAG: hypothetical protein HOW73_16940 [Polyangiaceae bacterium]|nr:hypothetical protein [Polyangiaceae bacterium]
MRQFLRDYQAVFPAITLVCGLLMMLQAFGYVRVSRDPEVEARWRRDRAPIMKVASIVLVLSSALGVVLNLV